MHITFYKAGKIPIPPALYGGTERKICWIIRGLLELGHQVTLIANAQSHIPGVELRPPAPDATDPAHWHRLIPPATDLVQIWDNPSVPPPKPCLLMVSGNGRPGETFPRNTVFISQHHAANHGSRHFIHNGLDLNEYTCAETRGDYAIFLAKARWAVKNLPGAIDVARRAGLELRVIGSRNWPLNLQRRLPAIRGVRYLGTFGGDEKHDLLARARCLIFPIRWEEPFGIAVIEALASGCYVAATPYDSLPEIVTPAVGCLSNRVAELAAAVKNPGLFNPRVCRDRITSGGFTHLDMARKFVACYERILAHGTLGDPAEPAPATRPGFHAKKLLPWHD
jgi:glycosyltransferase involved in cell wall biosynthesis